MCPRYLKVALCADISDCRISAHLSSISVGSNHKHIFDAAQLSVLLHVCILHHVNLPLRICLLLGVHNQD